MKPIFIICLFFALLNTLPTKIQIDVEQTDQINISYLADTVLAIPLKTTEFHLNSIDKVYMINDYIFILELLEEDGVIYSYVLKFDLSGNFKGRIGERDSKSKEFLRVYDMKYDITKTYIFLVNSDGYRVYDDDGKLFAFYEGTGKSPGLRAVQEFIFNNQVWMTKYSQKNGKIDINLIHSDLFGENEDTVLNYNIEPNKGNPVKLRLSQFSVNDKKMYISFGIDNTLYLMSQNKLSPIYKVEFINLPKSSNINLDLTQSIIGHLIQNNYWFKSVSYDHLYNTETNKSFNIKYQYHKGQLISGVRDDIYETGFFTINQTNQEDYLYFVKNPEELTGSKLYDPKLRYSLLFLIKLK